MQEGNVTGHNCSSQGACNLYQQLSDDLFGFVVLLVFFFYFIFKSVELLSTG